LVLFFLLFGRNFFVIILQKNLRMSIFCRTFAENTAMGQKYRKKTNKLFL